MLRGRHRGRTGWIVGDLDNLNPFATRALLNVDGDIVPIAIASLARVTQLELPLPAAQTKTPPA